MSKIVTEIQAVTVHLVVVNGIPFVDQMESPTPIPVASVTTAVIKIKPSQWPTKDFAVRFLFFELKLLIRILNKEIILGNNNSIRSSIV